MSNTMYKLEQRNNLLGIVNGGYGAVGGSFTALKTCIFHFTKLALLPCLRFALILNRAW